VGCLQQLVGVVPGEARHADGEGVAADQRQCVARVELDRVGGLCGAEPVALAEQGQAGFGQGGEVAGADGAVFVHAGVAAAVQCGEQGVGDRSAHAGAAGQELVEAHDHHRAHLFLGEHAAEAAGVAAQQAQAVLGPALGFDELVTVRAHAGGAAVHLSSHHEALAGAPRRFEAVESVLVQHHRGVIPGDPHHVVAAEGRAVQHDRGVIDHGTNVST
jgi:hypothetical protein